MPRLEDLEQDMSEVKQDLRDLRSEFKTDMRDFKKEIKQELREQTQEIRVDMDDMSTRLEAKMDSIAAAPASISPPAPSAIRSPVEKAALGTTVAGASMGGLYALVELIKVIVEFLSK